jgi:hypothetical protein
MAKPPYPLYLSLVKKTNILDGPVFREKVMLYLGRSVWAVRVMHWVGKTPFVKDGRRILLDIKDMNEWIDKNKVQLAY